MIFCDLPYAVTQNKWDVIIPFKELWEAYHRIVKDNGVFVLTSKIPFSITLGASNIENLKYEWIWKKENITGFLNANHMPLMEHENVLIFYRKKPTYNPQFTQGNPYTQKNGIDTTTNYGTQRSYITHNSGKRYPKTILEIPRDKEKLHPTQKPVALVEYMIKTYTNEGETVLDNCMGSGTSMIACINTDRNGIGIEMNKEIFEMAKKRIDNHVANKENTLSLESIFEE